MTSPAGAAASTPDSACAVLDFSSIMRRVLTCLASATHVMHGFHVAEGPTSLATAASLAEAFSRAECRAEVIDVSVGLGGGGGDDGGATAEAPCR